MIDLEEQRARLLDYLAQEVQDQRVLAATAKVRREDFVPAASRSLAYADHPLPIGYGQTISQPLIVAIMTEALALQGAEKVLEIGTGSGYQTAILAELARWVVSVERLEPLAQIAYQLLCSLGYRNIEVHVATKALGWPPGAPYDAILVTAGAPRVSQELLDQLAQRGRLVIPVGSRWEQELILVVKQGTELREQNLGPCRFVPLIGEGAWAEEEGVEDSTGGCETTW